MTSSLRRGIALGIILFACGPLHAESTGVGKIVSQVKVYTWNAKKGVWAEGQTIKRVTRTLDREGRPADETLAGGANDLLEKSTYVYNGDVQIVSVYGPDGKLRRTVRVERAGDLETETAVRSDGDILFVNQKKYSRAGLLAETRAGGRNGRLIFRKTYDYDRAGNLTAVAVHNPDDSLAFTIEYEYVKFDARGNWVIRSEFYTYGDVFRRPHEIVYRTFLRGDGTG